MICKYCNADYDYDEDSDGVYCSETCYYFADVDSHPR